MNGASVSRSLVCGPNFLCPGITLQVSTRVATGPVTVPVGGASNGVNSWIVIPADPALIAVSINHDFVRAVHLLPVALTREG